MIKMDLDKVFVIMCAYNEEKRIYDTIIDVRKYFPTNQIIVVDDGCTDNTYNEARNALDGKILPYRHRANLGKGAAMKTGVECAKSRDAEYVIFIDADGQHEAKEIPNFIEQLKKYDVVFGVRTHNDDMPIVSRLGNKLLNLCARFILGVKVNDIFSGYRAINLKIYNKFIWFEDRYGVELQQIHKVGKHKLNYTEIPIKTIYLDRYKGTGVLDGIKLLLTMIKLRVFR